jgi:hypothetical protein
MSKITIEKHDFDAKLVMLMGKIDEISEMIGSGDYVELANMMKSMKEIQTYQGEVLRTAEYRRLQNRVANPKSRSKTLAEKKDCISYDFCKNCDNWLAKSYMKQHLKTSICGRIMTSKSITKMTKKIATDIHLCGQVIAPIYHRRIYKIDRIKIFAPAEGEHTLERLDMRKIFANTITATYQDYLAEYRLPDLEF